MGSSWSYHRAGGSARLSPPGRPNATEALRDFFAPSGLALRQWVAASSWSLGAAVVVGLHIATRTQLERPK